MPSTPDNDESSIRLRDEDATSPILPRMEGDSFRLLLTPSFGIIYLLGFVHFFIFPYAFLGGDATSREVLGFYSYWLAGYLNVQDFLYVLREYDEIPGTIGVFSSLPWLIAAPMIYIMLPRLIGAGRPTHWWFLCILFLATHAKALIMYFVMALPPQNVGPFGLLWALLSDTVVYIICGLIILIGTLVRSAR